MRSKSLPGVAITTSTHLRIALTCGDCPTPPKITVCLIPVSAPYAAKLSQIWIASSLVGVRISVLILSAVFGSFGALCKSCRIGIANDAVFHVPVWAHHITSFPWRINGIDFS